MNTPSEPTQEPAPAAPPTRLRAYAGAPVVLTVTVLNVVAFLIELVVERSATALMQPKVTTMLAVGANYAAAVAHEHRWETLLTSCFLHFGLLHIGFNMVALRQVGPFVERLVGSGRFALLYLATGVFGAVTSAGWGGFKVFMAAGGHLAQRPELESAWSAGLERSSAGASGAICGVIGAVLVMGIRAQGFRNPLTRDMGRWLGTIVVFGLFLGFDNAAHIGGAVAGAIIAASWERARERPGPRFLRLLVASLALVIATARVIFVDMTNPYASLQTLDRYKLARALAAQGKCAEAKDALAAAKRLEPDAEELDVPLPGCL